MGRYSNKVSKATTSASVGVASVEAPASSMRRIGLSELIAGVYSDPPIDNILAFEVNRSTTAATGTSVTPNPNDPADAACVTLLNSSLTVQGTNTANVIPLSWSMNARTTFRWVCAPGEEIMVPATAHNGLHINTPVCVNTPSVSLHVKFEE